MKEKRETWVDNLRVSACLLVVAGHFFQSMVAANIIDDSALYQWFNKTIYYFHVPLFFICSGYLYQKNSGVRSFATWIRNLIKKAVTLGIPYFVFSIVTWGLKTVFSDAVNAQNDGLLQTLFLTPVSPYWYLYALFFIFAVTPIFVSRKKTVVLLAIAMILKLVRVYIGGTTVYAISTVMDNLIWFVLGMVICAFDVPELCCSSKWRGIGFLSAGLFLLCSIGIQLFKIKCLLLPLMMGLLGCCASVLLVWNTMQFTSIQKMMMFLSQYTMPIFLMHTIFAAGLRAVLLKLGVTNPILHISSGLMISFAGPMIAAELMKRMKLDILIYPGKYIKFSNNTEGNKHG